MRRSDIEVPNLPVDVALHSSCRLDYTFDSFEFGGVLWRSIDLRIMRSDAISRFREKSLQGNLTERAGENRRCSSQPKLR